MKLIINNGRIAATATDAYEGPDDFITVEDDAINMERLEDYKIVDGLPALETPIPQEVSIAQCRLALFDQHGIETDEQFYALVDILPEEKRPRALLELRTRPTVRYDNELVIAICAAKGWDIDALFIYAGGL